ncbi:peptidyl-prolyl cis-trans isomerase cpr6 [Varicellaria rhodocarpa]|nr:peptidyl-prolyl cis-trans isomerase cpr6 [Varicellaria rhodocarpa]
MPGVSEEAITSSSLVARTITSSKTAIELAIERASAHKVKGNLAFQAREYHQAWQHYGDGIGALREVTEVWTNLGATKHIVDALVLNQSLMYYHLGCYADAARNADQAIGIHELGLENKEMAQACFRRRQAKAKMEGEYKEGGYKEEARQDLKKAAELAPGDETILRELSYLG